MDGSYQLYSASCAGGTAFVQHWDPLGASLVVGAVGVLQARRASIMEDVSVTDSPEGPG